MAYVGMGYKYAIGQIIVSAIGEGIKVMQLLFDIGGGFKKPPFFSDRVDQGK
jgi:hypothetical protein